MRPERAGCEHPGSAFARLRAAQTRHPRLAATVGPDDDLGMVSAVFRPRPGLSRFEFAICARQRGPLETDLGVPVLIDQDLAALERADLILILPGADHLTPPVDEVFDALRRAHRRGAMVAAHCRGVFTLAAAGLLDGREVTTHWQYANDLAARYPSITIRPGALYVDQGSIVTGAGAAAGMDMYLHLVRREHGAALTNEIARLLVVPPHRDGGQQQYISNAVAADGDGERLAEVIAWARVNLDRRLSVDDLAGRALTSRRSFIRHFKAATGTTPHAWLLAQRLNRAEELLETTDLSIQQVAERVGYGTAAVLREQFTVRRGVAPRDYRRTFNRN
jgi:transcriptional regulator GlxA family with amidase domain